MLQLDTVGAVLTKTAKLHPAATAMSVATISTTAAMTSHQLAAIHLSGVNSSSSSEAI